MSENTETIETETTETKTRGQSKKTPEELRAAFDDCVKAIGAEGLMLQVDEKGRCKVIHVDADNGEFNEVIKPVAGNTFVRYLEGVRNFAPYVG